MLLLLGCGVRFYRRTVKVMLWLAALGAALLLATSTALAGNLEDCNQHEDLDRLIRGCTEVLVGNAELKHQAHAYANRGRAHAAKEQYDLALRDLDKALELQPSDVSLLYVRALVHEKKGETDRAFRDYDKLIALNPGNPYALMGFLKKMTAVNQDVNKVIALNPRDPFALHERARNYHM